MAHPPPLSYTRVPQKFPIVFPVLGITFTKSSLQGLALTVIAPLLFNYGANLVYS